MREYPRERKRAARLFIRSCRLTPLRDADCVRDRIGCFAVRPTIPLAELLTAELRAAEVTGVAPTQWVGGAQTSAPFVGPGVWCRGIQPVRLRRRGGADDPATPDLGTLVGLL